MPENDNIPSTAPYPRKDAPGAHHTQRNAALLGGGALLLALGIAGGMMISRNNDRNETPIEFGAPAAGVTDPVTSPDPTVQMGATTPPDTTVGERRETSQKRRSSSSDSDRGTSASAGPGEYESRRLAKAVCSYCGTVESVTAVPVQDKSTGVGAVAGGVVGGVLGNQVGKGSGNTAATVLGAIGGGIAGNEIEKRRNTQTVYRVKVRMDDGTTKTFTRPTELSPGTEVEVRDGEMKVVGASG